MTDARGACELKIVFCKKDPKPTIDDIPVGYRYVSTMEVPRESGRIYAVVKLIVLVGGGILAFHYADHLEHFAIKLISTITGINAAFFSESKPILISSTIFCCMLVFVIEVVIHEGIHMIFTPNPFSDVKVYVWINLIAVSVRSDCVFSRRQEIIQSVAPLVVFQAVIVYALISSLNVQVFLILTFVNFSCTYLDLMHCYTVLKQLPQKGLMYYRYIVEKENIE